MAQREPLDPTDPSDDPPGANRPGELEHPSGEIDEFEAATRTGGLFDGGEAVATASRPRSGGEVERGRQTGVLAFLRACWAELQRVQWPDRRQVGQATAVVLGFVVIAGTFLGVADVAARELVDLII
jgi:preprotein translocase SecE subunit